MLVDAHCHLTGSYLPPDALEPTLARARSEGVLGFIAVGTDSNLMVKATSALVGKFKGSAPQAAPKGNY